MDMNVETIEKIQELSKPNIVSENSYVYTDKPLSLIHRPKVETIFLSTLDSLVNVVKAEVMRYDGALIVHVDNEREVYVYSGINEEDRSREKPFRAEAVIPQLTLNRNTDYESMMIALKSKFVDSPELSELVQLLGTITEENHTQIADDGFTQTVTVRQGIAIKGNKAINPIVKLRPYRTFLEVEQPASRFLVRLSEGTQVAIYEADGGAWKLEARRNIYNYLVASLEELISKGEVIVIA